MRDFIGINGHTVQFKPELYQPVCRLVRDYHPVEWDLDKNTQELPRFPLAKNGVDWSKVYGSWRMRGWNIDACLMIETVQQRDWKSLESDARAYGSGKTFPNRGRWHQNHPGRSLGLPQTFGRAERVTLNIADNHIKPTPTVQSF